MLVMLVCVRARAHQYSRCKRMMEGRRGKGGGRSQRVEIGWAVVEVRQEEKRWVGLAKEREWGRAHVHRKHAIVSGMLTIYRGSIILANIHICIYWNCVYVCVGVYKLVLFVVNVNSFLLFLCPLYLLWSTFIIVSLYEFLFLII